MLWHLSWLIYPFVEPLHRGRALAGSTIGDTDLSVGIALVALALSGWVAIRQWRRDRVSDEEAKAAFVQVRLIGYDGETWWRIENHGPQTAWLWALNVVAIDAPSEAEHGKGDDLNEPSPADPPLNDPRLLPRLLPPDSYVFIQADLGDTTPPYRAMVWFSDRQDDRRGRKAVLRPVGIEPPL